MVNYILILFTLIIFLPFSTSIQETTNFMKELKNVEKNGKCLEAVKEGEDIIVYIGKCPNGQHCKVTDDYETLLSEGPINCKDNLKFNGQECKENTECFSNKCEKGVCKKNSKCDKHEQCDYNEYCKENVCVNAQILGGKCTKTYECQSKLGCNNHTCIEYFSLDLGEYSENLNFCKTNFIISENYQGNLNQEKENICVKKVKKEGYAEICESNSDCPVKSFYGKNENEYINDYNFCLENLNSRISKCMYDSDSKEYTAFVKEIIEQYKKNDKLIHWAYVMDEGDLLPIYIGREENFEISSNYWPDLQNLPNFYKETLKQYIRTGLIEKKNKSLFINLRLFGAILLLVLALF